MLYGDLDIDAMLSFLDERHLSPVAAEQQAADAERASAGLDPLRPRTIELQGPVTDLGRVVEMGTAPENACLGLGFCLGRAGDVKRVSAAGVLADALLGSNEAPLRRALLDAGIADDIDAACETALAQPFLAITARGLHEGAAQRFWPAVREHAQRILDEGLDHALLTAALDHAEFSLREADFGYSTGVALALSSLSAWIYDDSDDDALACARVRYEKCLAKLRAGLDGDFYERLLREVVLNNPHMAAVELRPVDTAGDPAAPELAAKLAAMDEAARAAVAAEVEKLREAQMRPDAPEAKASLPRLSVSDIGAMPQDPAWRLDTSREIACIRHEVETRGIVYTDRYFDLRQIAAEDLPLAQILTMVLGRLGTASHSAAEIDTLLQSRLGHFSAGIDMGEDERDPQAFRASLKVSAHALAANAGDAASLVREICLSSDFDDTERIRNILQQAKIGMEQAFSTAGHVYARTRARSHYAYSGFVAEQTGGVDFYRFLRELLAHYDERAATLPAQLSRVASELFCDDACTASFAGPAAGWESWWDAGVAFGTKSAGAKLVVPRPARRDEAFIVGGDVCYAACGYDRRLLDGAAPFSGAWLVANRALSFDYLWNEIRVKGGAYGVGFAASWLGNMAYHTFRDPHLDPSLERIGQAAGWLAAFDPDPATLEGLVVATVAGIDAPVKPRALIARQNIEYFTGRDPQARARLRDEALATKPADLRALAADLAVADEHRCVCVFGSGQILRESKAGLHVVDLLNE